MRKTLGLTGTTLFIGLAAFAPRAAEACGCFAAPTPAQPVVQAGERIVFGYSDGKVTAHIQIQYQGDASDFAWMLPMPAVPEFRLGSQELFDALEATTRPQFLLQGQAGEGCGGSGFGCGGAESFLATASRDAGGETGGVAVVQSSAGPYEYAVVRADEKAPMFDWLRDNGYFVPSASDASFDPYIRPNAFFLALKLKADATTGDLQPIVVEYASDFPMIPIILTSMGAVPDMGILVYVLGDSRAIPHNYQHVEINEEYIDWNNQASNYAEVVSRAIDEAEGHHAFVTEYAGSAVGAQTRIGPAARFGEQDRLVLQTSITGFVQHMQTFDYPAVALRGILQPLLDVPDEALDSITDQSSFFGPTDDQQYWEVFREYAARNSDLEFDPVALADEIWTRVILPTQEAIGFLGDFRYVTRLLTTLDPEEMTKDPAFSFNPDLPDVSNVHTATQINHCNGAPNELILNDGRIYLSDDDQVFAVAPKAGIPFASTVEILGQEGPPQIVTDNRGLLADSDDSGAGGCTHVRYRHRRGLGASIVLGLFFVARHVMRRRRSRA